MSIARSSTEDAPPDLKKGRLEARLALSFSDKDKIVTLQPHDDALIVTLKIGRYDVKRVCWWIRAAMQRSCTPTYLKG